ISNVRARHKGVNQSGKGAAENAMQVEIGELVVDIAVEYDDIAGVVGWTLSPLPPYYEGKIERVEQIKEMPRHGQVPTAHVFVTTVHGPPRRADSAFAPVDAVNETFPEFHPKNNVVPEGEPARPQAGAMKSGTQILNLSRLPGSIHSGETDQQG